MLKRTILVTGANGYIGNGIVQRLLGEGHLVVGVDNNIKSHWLSNMKSKSALSDFAHRNESIKKIHKSYNFISMDVTDKKMIDLLFRRFDFDTIINLAQQPSAPYSQMSHEAASWTISNNVSGCINILWAMKEFCPNAHLIEIESMGTFQPDVGVDIPENQFVFEFNGRTSKPSIFPRRSASNYHASKIFNTYLTESANRWWGLTSTSINQGVVYGNYTPEIEKSDIQSFLASDESFGTVINRFMIQALLGVPLTMYGEGNQKRGYLALNDSVQALQLFVDNPPELHTQRGVNQLDEVFSVNEIADKVITVAKRVLKKDVTKTNIEPPRIEPTNDFYYNPITEVLPSLGFKQTRSVEDEIEYCFKKVNKRVLPHLKELVEPKIVW